jgi:O-antigen ligase
MVRALARRAADYWKGLAGSTEARANTAQRLVLLLCLLLLPAVEWFSLVRVGPAIPPVGELTLPKFVLFCLVLTLPFAIRRRRQALGVPVVLVICLALWMVIANVSRPTYPGDSLRAAVAFALASTAAFVGAYIVAGSLPAQYARGVTWILLGMLCLSTASGALERFSLYRLPDGSIADRFAGLWTFFRPAAPLTSPVLGAVSVVHAHTVESLDDPTVPRVAGFFASSNALADFIVVSFPTVVLATIGRIRTTSMVQRLAIGVLLLGTLQAVVWTQSRLALAAIAAQILLIGILAVLRKRPTQPPMAPQGARRVEMAIVLTLLAALALATMVGVLNDPAFRSRLNADELFQSELFVRGHIALQRAGLALVTVSHDAMLFGPGQYAYIAAINDPASPFQIPDVDPGVGAPHSLYLTFAVAAGLPGLALFVLLVAVVLAQCGRQLVMPSTVMQSVLQALVIGVLGLMLVGLFDLNPLSLPETLLIFSLLGSVAGYSRMLHSTSPASA